MSAELGEGMIAARERLGWTLAGVMVCIGLGLPILTTGLVLEPAGCSAARSESAVEAERQARQLREQRLVEDQHRRAVEAAKKRR